MPRWVPPERCLRQIATEDIDVRALRIELVEVVAEQSVPADAVEVRRAGWQHVEKGRGPLVVTGLVRDERLGAPVLIRHRRGPRERHDGQRKLEVRRNRARDLDLRVDGQILGERSHRRERCGARAAADEFVRDAPRVEPAAERDDRIRSARGEFPHRRGEDLVGAIDVGVEVGAFVADLGRPVASRDRGAVTVPGQDRGGGHTTNGLPQRAGRQRPPGVHHVVDGFQVELEVGFRTADHRADCRAERQRGALARPVDRPRRPAVGDEHETALVGVPKGAGEHTVQACDRIGTTTRREQRLNARFRIGPVEEVSAEQRCPRAVRGHGRFGEVTFATGDRVPERVLVLLDQGQIGVGDQPECHRRDCGSRVLRGEVEARGESGHGATRTSLSACAAFAYLIAVELEADDRDGGCAAQ